MRFHCSNCHNQFESADPRPEACPRCHAEAGLEHIVPVALPMKLFGALLAGVLVSSGAAAVIGLLGRMG